MLAAPADDALKLRQRHLKAVRLFGSTMAGCCVYSSEAVSLYNSVVARCWFCVYVPSPIFLLTSINNILRLVTVAVTVVSVFEYT